MKSVYVHNIIRRTLMRLMRPTRQCLRVVIDAADPTVAEKEMYKTDTNDQSEASEVVDGRNNDITIQ